MNKSDEALRNELISLITEISKDQIRQPANRRKGDFYESKQVFLDRGRSEKDHLRWYDKKRHRHMKLFLLDHYNSLNEQRHLTSIDELKTLRPDPLATYPDIGWLEAACHAAVAGIDELKHEEAKDHEPQENERITGISSRLRERRLAPAGKPLDIDEVAEIIARIEGKPIPLVRSNLSKLCSRRAKAMTARGLTLPQPLYQKRSQVPDLYIIEIAEFGTGHRFQRIRRL